VLQVIDLGDDMQFTKLPSGATADNLVCSDPTIPHDDSNLVIKVRQQQQQQQQQWAKAAAAVLLFISCSMQPHDLPDSSCSGFSCAHGEWLRSTTAQRAQLSS
jgi:hypothetical protein